MKGKVIIITGCNSPLGIGRASAHQFAHNGAKAIFICDFNTQHLETHKRELNSLYPDVDIHPRKVDAGKEADIEGIINEALEKYERLDVFFANAGISITTERFLEVSRGFPLEIVGLLGGVYLRFANPSKGSADKFMKTMRTNALR